MGSVKLGPKVFTCCLGVALIGYYLELEGREIPLGIHGGWRFFEEDGLQGSHQWREGVDYLHGNVLLLDVTICPLDFLIHKVGEVHECCDKVTEVVIVTNLCIVVVLSCIVLS